MAVTQSTASMKMKMKESDFEEGNPSDQSPPPACPPPPHAKRRKCPGVRIINGRIYDSENGNTCHQCRQKTRDDVAKCKVEKKTNKICPIKFCRKCLLQRYGELVEVVDLWSDWQCPKCRDICNCSSCQKKRGLNPTGILIHKAKANGFSSVAEMLQVLGPENVVGTSPKKRNASSKDPVVFLCNVGMKIFDNKSDSNLEQKDLIIEGSLDDTKQEEEMDKTDDCVQSKNSKKTRLSQEAIRNTVKGEEEEITERDNGGTDSQSSTSEEINLEHINKEDKMDAEAKPYPVTNKLIPDIPLPQGVELRTVAGIDLPHEDVARAIQFLEFCQYFGEVLDLKKGQAKSILQELTDQCSRVRGQYSVVVQFYMQLLSLILKDKGEESTLSSINNGTSWLQVLEKYISESNRALINLPSDCFAKDGVGYDSLAPSEKLRLMNFLCDESLSTVDLRNWIGIQQSKLSVRAKEAKEKVVAAKDKEKLLKQKMGEVAKAYMSKNGASSSISEHENLFSQIKAEASQAHTETLEAIDMVPKKKQRSDAVRTDPVFVDGKGWAFWRLKSCSSEPNILLQDIRSCDSSTAEEKWFIYDKEKVKQVEQYISFARRKRRRIQVVSDALEQETSDTSIKNET